MIVLGGLALLVLVIAVVLKKRGLSGGQLPLFVAAGIVCIIIATPFAMLTDLFCPSEGQRVPLNGNFLPCLLKVTVRHVSCLSFARQSLSTIFLRNFHDRRPQ
jgi:hypothetical protein